MNDMNKCWVLNFIYVHYNLINKDNRRGLEGKSHFFTVKLAFIPTNFNKNEWSEDTRLASIL